MNDKFSTDLRLSSILLPIAMNCKSDRLKRDRNVNDLGRRASESVTEQQEKGSHMLQSAVSEITEV